MESIEQFVDKLSLFAQTLAQSADTDIILAGVASVSVILLLLVIALRSTVYRNLDRRGLFGVAKRVEQVERDMAALRDEMSNTLAELRELANNLRRDLAGGEEGGGAQGGGGPAPRSGGGQGPLGGGGRIAAPVTTAPPTAPTPVAVPAVEVVPVPEPTPIVRGMERSRTTFLGRLKSFLAGRKSVDETSLDDLEELLVMSDVGARCAQALVGRVREAAAQNREVDESQLKEILRSGVRSELISVSSDHRMYTPSGSPQVILVVGVNGVGKTTTVAKLAARYSKQGKRVMVIAADTFRAAAVQQLEEWSKRVGFTLVKGAENAKPGAVVFDGMAAAKDGSVDVVLIDTAGRLHTKSNLMQELEGVRNSIRKHVPDAPHETILVLDGVSGQNALAQAREFNGAVQLTGIVVTKLDGTPKGGILIAISQELKIPVLYVGVGEKAEDLIPFDADQFVDALLSDGNGDDGSQSVWGRGPGGSGVHGVVIN